MKESSITFSLVKINCSHFCGSSNFYICYFSLLDATEIFRYTIIRIDTKGGQSDMLSDNIKKLRKDKGLSQEEFAAKLNVVRQTVSKWENGLSVPDAEMLIKIADELNATVSELLDTKINTDKMSDTQNVSEKLEQINNMLAKQKETRRKILRAMFLVVLIISVLMLSISLIDVVYNQISINNITADTTIIGGYNGPTSIYVLNKIFKPIPFAVIFIFIITSIIGVHKTRR